MSNILIHGYLYYVTWTFVMISLLVGAISAMLKFIVVLATCFYISTCFAISVVITITNTRNRDDYEHLKS